MLLLFLFGFSDTPVTYGMTMSIRKDSLAEADVKPHHLKRQVVACLNIDQNNNEILY